MTSDRLEQMTWPEAVPDLYTLEGAATRLGISRSTVQRLVRQGHLKLVHPTPAAARITGRSIDAYLLLIGAEA